nr:Ribosomal protein L20 [Pedinophyceae sp. YPF-701]
MTRVKRGFVARRRRKKVMDRTEGFLGSSSKLFRTANQRYMKALKFSYRDRKVRKREMRSLWITRLNAAVQTYGLNYSTFIHKMKLAQVGLNRKVLSQLVIFDQEAFSKVVDTITK